MFVCAVGAQLALVATVVATNYWRNAFFQTLQDKDWTGFLTQFGIHSVIGIFFTLAAVYHHYFMQWLSLARVLLACLTR